MEAAAHYETDLPRPVEVEWDEASRQLWYRCGVAGVIEAYRQIAPAKVAGCLRGNFEDRLLFVLQVERILDGLSDEEREMFGAMALHEMTQRDAAARMGVSVRTVLRMWARLEAKLVRMFLDAGLIARVN